MLNIFIVLGCYNAKNDNVKGFEKRSALPIFYAKPAFSKITNLDIAKTIVMNGFKFDQSQETFTTSGSD